MAGRADDGRPIPRVGLRFTLRFQAVVAEKDVLSRTWFCRKVIMEQLQLKVDAIYCLQWNQQERAFDVTLKDEQVYTKVAMDCVAAAMVKPLACYKVLNLDRSNLRTITVHMFNPFVTDRALADFLWQYGEVLTAARHVKDTMGIWTGRRQFQVLLKSELEGCGGLKRPPASFSLGADRGYLSNRGSRLSAGGAGNEATWRECAMAPAAGFVVKGGMKPKAARCPRPAMVAVGKITSTEAVLGGGGRLQR
ncbi:Zinc finger CCHC domain containing protein 3 [Dissostichus eleginoides]|uniref:Zinc finger CCHC domain containing protein 3 n=1 Tax=Dissostichus eleginoides TaxID=100907 RepID=A0AAD9ES37_DISEL|nr:Zinc finger CCHC domain containing protein 3 [Dissostichus eleginoides]